MSLLSFRSVFRPMFRSRSLLLALFLLPLVHAPAAFAHGSHGGGGSETLEEGEFDFTPLITVEAHGGFDTNLEDINGLRIVIVL